LNISPRTKRCVSDDLQETEKSLDLEKDIPNLSMKKITRQSKKIHCETCAPYYSGDRGYFFKLKDGVW
jgi:hypothetical protein